MIFKKVKKILIEYFQRLELVNNIFLFFANVVIEFYFK